MPALLVVAVLLATGCGREDESAGPTSAAAGFESRPVITLVVNDWTASALDVAIAEQLIERHLGYPVVGARIDDSAEIYDGLADGSLDGLLEIWPSAMTDRDRQYFDSGRVHDIGTLGPVGQVGWWVPRYLVDENPALATWEGYLDPAVAEQFATPATAPKGTFLGTAAGYEQYDEQIIDNLGLPFTVMFTGSEQATTEVLDQRVGLAEPVLTYWWTPTAAIKQFDLTQVELPPSTDECEASRATGDGGVDCAYPADALFKAMSPQLPTKAPAVAEFLTRFELTTADQIELLYRVEVEQRSVEAAAGEWIAANRDRWQPWVDAAVTAGGDDPPGSD
ncbi:MAG: glycine betaine ABC transporter substrate-binding protein [Acidimicrobiales bacterium]